MSFVPGRPRCPSVPLLPDRRVVPGTRRPVDGVWSPTPVSKSRICQERMLLRHSKTKLGSPQKNSPKGTIILEWRKYGQKGGPPSGRGAKEKQPLAGKQGRLHVKRKARTHAAALHCTPSAGYLFMELWQFALLHADVKNKGKLASLPSSVVSDPAMGRQHRLSVDRCVVPYPGRPRIPPSRPVSSDWTVGIPTSPVTHRKGKALACGSRWRRKAAGCIFFLDFSLSFV